MARNDFGLGDGGGLVILKLAIFYEVMMEIFEVVRLADWFSQNTVDVEQKYAVLVTILQNNAQQTVQQPVTEPLKELSKTLAGMPTQELSGL